MKKIVKRTIGFILLINAIPAYSILTGWVDNYTLLELYLIGWCANIFIAIILLFLVGLLWIISWCFE